ncbi:MAG: LysM peptidoglycan-binding domain-containing protein [Bacilli bacterium]|nr:LysM peptidoglycan-binding domain-containing protein [Bacilli bacterium]
MDRKTIRGVVVDAGHGGSDPGAISGNLKEKDLNLKAALYMAKRLEELGIPVVLTRNSDETLSRDERVRRIRNAFGSDPNVILISNHINAGGGEGAEIVYALRNNDTLSTSALDNIGNAGQKKRKVYQRRLPENPNQDYYFIQRLTSPLEALLVEYGFIDNKNDQIKLENNIEDYVEGVVKAIADYAGVSYSTDGDTYIVKKGDTLYSIARRYNMSVDNLKTLNNLTSNEIQIGQVLKVSNKDQLNKDVIVYIVQRGDSLYKISKMFGTTIESIKRLNNLSSDIITPGQELVINENIPVGENNYYVVKKGDTLYGIAKNNNITVDDLIKTNNLTSLILKVGDKLIVP